MRRIAKKQTLEMKKEELSPFANDLKTAIIQADQVHVPIERVIYVNDSNYVKHTPGTNRYTINFPEDFMTSNQKKVIGVRSIQLRHGSSRTYSFSFSFSYFMYNTPLMKPGYVDKIDIVEQFKFEITYNKHENPDPQQWVEQLNSKWNTYKTNFKNIDDYRWKCTYNDDSKLYILELTPSSSSLNNNPIIFKLNNVSPDLLNTDVKFEQVEYRTISEPLKDIPAKLPKITIPGPLETYEEYLVAASFVGQTSNSYLGFTNMTFNPPKLYPLTSNDMNFWLDLSSSDGLSPRELPCDGHDLLILEIQLMYLPMLTKK